MINRRQFSTGGAALIATASLAACSSSDTGPAAAPATTTTSKNTSFGPLKQVQAGVLNIGYAEAGPADGPVVILLHGWPYDIHAFVDVAPLLTAKGYRVLVPYLRGYGTTTFLKGDTVRNAQQTTFASDIVAFMDALKVDKAVLGGFDWGARTACVVAALWPQRVKALVSDGGYIITCLKGNLQPLPPVGELAWWYQYYFATERGVMGYTKNRHDFNKLIWQGASPKWRFDDATYERSATAFDNPDHVAIVIHNYRWRLSLAPGEPAYDALEQKLADAPAITVPTITMASDFEGAAADGMAYRSKFTAKYEHRVLNGIGHNVPQEAPEEFAKAILDVDKF
ncbi:alpha/beta hydrolase [Kibdelosporangium philippinense]|uniref:Alpha/beta hydrolase n=1 Tax=Kibdelosporangium philippinense TaxID=211113 RepID=A0ABS8ZRQ0_9PSEU|nr:alpha/beta hydrolase [Kibdelosporangium philippinense]MCE7010282.1 alpha/beta hydrolase [Kibdelosporangium philippinense]